MLDLTSKIRIIIAAAILTPVLLYWGFAGSPHENAAPTGPLSDKMDYFVDQAVLKEWDLKGDLKQDLHTPRMEHDPKQKQNLLYTPKSNHYRLDKPTINISSERGTIKDDNSRIDLAGKVRVIDNQVSEASKTLATEALTIFPPKDFAETDLPVNLTSKTSQMNGTGMDINFNTRVLNLHSRVEGTFTNAK